MSAWPAATACSWTGVASRPATAPAGTRGRRLLINRNVEAAVFENDAAAILRDGLAYDRCTVGVVTDLGGVDALAEHDVHDADQMLKVLRTQVDVVLADGVAVLNAADERIAALARLCDGDVMFYALDEHSPALRAQRAAGGRAVFVRDGDCVLAEGAAETAAAASGAADRPGRDPAARGAAGRRGRRLGHGHRARPDRRRRADLRPSPGGHARQHAACGDRRRKGGRLMESPASARCAAPTCGAGTRPIEAIVRCSDDESAIARLPAFEPRLRALFPAIGRAPGPSTTVRCRWPRCWNWPRWRCRPRPAAR